MNRPRSGHALLGGLVVLASFGCQPAQREPPRQVVAEFSGLMDGRTGELSLGTTSPEAMSVGMTPGRPGVLLALVAITTAQDGVPGQGTAGTVELVTTATSSSCGRPNTFCADVTVRSFYAAEELHNVFVEITEMTPSVGSLGLGSTATPTGGNPGAGQVSATFGLWAYPALLDLARGTVAGGSSPGANAATRRWYFDNMTSQPFTFKGRVMADVVAAVGTGQDGTCGGSPTSLATTGNCGECGRTCAGGSCTYVGTQPVPGTGVAAQAGALLDYQCVCGGALTACDSASSSALACVDLQADPANCGICGNDCQGGLCVAGVCQPAALACPAGSSACATNCCPIGTTCSLGHCLLSDATSVSVGGDGACATRTRAIVPTGSPGFHDFVPTVPNNVVCWGQSWFGGNGWPNGYANPQWPFATPVPEWGEPAAPYQFAGALRDDMFSVSRGGREGVGITHHPVPVGEFHPTALYQWGEGANAVGGWNGLLTKVVRGGLHGCAMGFATGQPSRTAFVYCWAETGVGSNALGQLGSCDDVIHLDNSWITPGVDCVPPNASDPAHGLLATDIAAAGDTTCAVLAAEDLSTGQSNGIGQVAGTVACWGDNANGKAGGPISDVSYLSAHLVRLTPGGTPLGNAVKVAVGAHHAVALLGNGDLAFWGLNDAGQFGTASAAAPALVTIRTPAEGAISGAVDGQLSAGQDFTCYVAGGTVYCHGRNDRGQLGDGTYTNRLTPVRVQGLAGATAVSAGGVPATGDPAHGSACAVWGPGYLSCWGDNANGLLGGGSSSPPTSSIPQLVELAPVPFAPGAVVATPGAGSVTVTWAAAAGATSYNLYWSTDPAVLTPRNAVTTVTSGAVVGGLTPGTSYSFVVTARSGSGESVDSAIATATP